MKAAHAMRFGATVLDAGGVRFALWAPGWRSVTVQRCDAGGRTLAEHALQRRDDGWHEGVWPEAEAGWLYRYRLDDGTAVPDPASRRNPQGVHGPSEVVDPADHEWHDEGWQGLPWHRTSVYELHVGSFTPEGSFEAAALRLPYLRSIGIRAIELMPLAAFSGQRGWGYDGVLPFAPHAPYGTPQQLKRFIDRAHRLGLMVLLDVVYNHFGADGNHLHRWCPEFFDPSQPTPWGAALRVDGEAGRTVRRFFVDNALYWVREYRFDGLRLDAVHAMPDGSPPHLVEEIASALREGPGRERHVHLVLENDANRARWLARDPGGRAAVATAQWNDDWHHAAHVLATGERHGYYRDHADAPLRDLARALAEGFVYQGQPSAHRGMQPRGEPSAALPPTAFVNFLQNHDQVGNRACGERLDALLPPARVEWLLACLLLAPQVPMLFMGEEFATRSPFLYFCDYHGDMAEAVREGRRREFAGFPGFGDAAARQQLPDPNAPSSFSASMLRWQELCEPDARRRLALVQQLLGLRRDHLEPQLVAPYRGATWSSSDEAFAVEWRFGMTGYWRMRGSMAETAPRGPLAPEEREVFRNAAGTLRVTTGRFR